MQKRTHEIIIVVDFGSQYSHLIARRIREQNVYSKIVSHKITPEEIKHLNPKGIILSGGPASVYVSNAPRCDEKILYMDIPVLGICYGFQLGSQILGAEIKSSENREYAKTGGKREGYLRPVRRCRFCRCCCTYLQCNRQQAFLHFRRQRITEKER